jgi:Stage II sporulation protein E (SpoIIE)/GAF domain
VAEELVRAVTVGEVVAAITTIGRRTIGADWSYVAVLDPDGLALVPGENEPGWLTETRTRWPQDAATPTAESVRTGWPLFIGSRAELTRVFTDQRLLEFVDSAGERAWAILPLIGSSGRLGALRLCYGVEQDFPDDTRRFLRAVAQQCAIALERARLFAGAGRSGPGRRPDRPGPAGRAGRAGRDGDRVYAVLNPADGTVAMGDAGHPPLVHLPMDGPAELVDPSPGTTPVGVPEGRAAHRVQLRRGAVIVAFTDGLVETRDRPLDDGTATLIRCLERVRDRPLADILDMAVETMWTQPDPTTGPFSGYAGLGAERGCVREASAVSECCVACRQGSTP